MRDFISTMCFLSPFSSHLFTMESMREALALVRLACDLNDLVADDAWADPEDSVEIYINPNDAYFSISAFAKKK